MGRALRGADVSDIGWFKPDGAEMTDGDWQSGFGRSIGMFLNGKAIPTVDSRGEPVVDDSFYLLFNAHYEAINFKLPTGPWGERWVPVIDTNEPVPDLRGRREMNAGQDVQVQSYSLMVLKRVG
jgi:isoamylase